MFNRFDVRDSIGKADSDKGVGRLDEFPSERGRDVLDARLLGHLGNVLGQLSASLVIQSRVDLVQDADRRLAALLEGKDEGQSDDSLLPARHVANVGVVLALLEADFDGDADNFPPRI